ncbi:MAG: hypothetical protein KAI83_20375 [Thiomargarita sp.]|nr:hypothetical protein [Thiomargarita sp.]
MLTKIIESVLLDTNIVSFLLKGDTRAQDYEVYLQNRTLTISVMTVAELFQWAAIRNWGERRVSQLVDVGWVGAKRKPTVRWKMVGFHFAPTHPTLQCH